MPIFRTVRIQCDKLKRGNWRLVSSCRLNSSSIL